MLRSMNALKTSTAGICNKVEDRKAAAQKQGLKDNEDYIEDEGSRSERERKDLAKHIRKRADRRCADV